MPLDPERVQVLLTLEKQRRIRFGAVMYCRSSALDGFTETAAGIIAVQALETECLAEVPCVTASDRHGLVGACVGGEK